MSKLPACLLLLLLVRSAHSVTDSCLEKNPFLKVMSTAVPVSVQVFPAVKTGEFEHCKYEWAKYGACCDQHDLAGFAQLEGVLLKSNENALIKAFNEMRTAIERSGDMFIVSPHENKQAESATKGLKQYRGQYSFENFKEESNKCWKTMGETRSSALCSICSGRSQIFFKKGKILVPQETCQKVVEDCELFFLKLSTIIKRFPQVLESYKRMNVINDVEFLEYEILQKELSSYCPPKELLDAFALYEESKSLDQRTDLKASNICSMILNIRKTPYIIEMNPENIEAVAKTTMQQLQRKFDKAVESLIAKDKKAVDELHATRDRKLADEKVPHDQAIARLSGIPQKNTVTKLVCATFIKTLCVSKKTVVESVDNPAYSIPYNAEIQRYNTIKNKIIQEADKAVGEIINKSQKIQEEIQQNHLQKIEVVENEKMINLKRWEEKKSKGRKNDSSNTHPSKNGKKEGEVKNLNPTTKSSGEPKSKPASESSQPVDQSKTPAPEPLKKEGDSPLKTNSNWNSPSAPKADTKQPVPASQPATSAAKGKGRSLSELLAANNILAQGAGRFDSDSLVYIRAADGMFDHAGIKGACLDVNAGDFMPANLTLAFN
jgi:hypothetical protein